MKGLSLIPILFAIFCAGCSKTDALMEVPDKMDKMNHTTTEMVDKMDRTNAAIHDQQVLIPYKELLDPVNGEILSPIPFRMMAFGEKLAEAVTATELVKIVHLHLKEFQTVQFEEKVGADGVSVPSRAEQIEAFDHGKIARLTALMVLAGFVPEKTLNEAIDAQIKKSGPYEETTYQLLMLRYQFINDVLLESSLLIGTLESIGRVEEAIKYAKQLDDICQLPFWSRIVFHPKGFSDSSESQPIRVNQRDMIPLWKRIKADFSADKILEGQALTGDPQQDEALLLQKKARLTAASAVIEAKIADWTAKLP
jgi:hypothetical protein